MEGCFFGIRSRVIFISLVLQDFKYVDLASESVTGGGHELLVVQNRLPRVHVGRSKYILPHPR